MHGEIKTPPMGIEARREAGFILRSLQQGLNVGMPHVRPMTVIGTRCVELRINDVNTTWRIMCSVESDAIVILDVFRKKTQQTPKAVIQLCKSRLAMYHEDIKS